MPVDYHHECYSSLSPAPARWGQFAHCDKVCYSCGEHATAGITAFVD